MTDPDAEDCSLALASTTGQPEVLACGFHVCAPPIATNNDSALYADNVTDRHMRPRCKCP